MTTFYSPDESLSIKDYQNANFTVLKHLVDFLNQNNIEYWLYAGSLLGIVRHGDFIPWDDDIDIAMNKDNYNKFKLLAKKNLPAGLNFIDDTKWCGAMCKITMNDYFIVEKHPNLSIYGVYVDIFCFIPQLLFPQKLYLKMLKAFRFIEEYGLRRYYHMSFKTLIASLSIMPTWKIYQLFWYLWPKSKFLATRPINNNTFDLHHINDIYPLKEVIWRDLTVNVPNQQFNFLAEQYGKNFMELPPGDKRYWHANIIIRNK